MTMTATRTHEACDAAPKDDEARRFTAMVTDAFREYAGLLERQGANPFRARAYRGAADVLPLLEANVLDLGRHGCVDELLALPSIGTAIAQAIIELAQTGRWFNLELVRDRSAPISLFQSLPGVGPELAKRIVDTLAVQTLEDLEIAVHSERIFAVPGIGPRRAAALRAELAEKLKRIPGKSVPEDRQPPVSLLLAIDRDFRALARRMQLRTVRQRRFNPMGESAPRLERTVGQWRCTAMYSNSPLAHTLKRQGEWVLILYETQDHCQGYAAAVTARNGVAAGQRVIRGREQECLQWYAAKRPRSSRPSLEQRQLLFDAFRSVLEEKTGITV
ncbi:MAG: hypothetical protein KDD69_05225 [Bdellovibrionales bacterium]|nr:hypothetical protein [Bdellovibrionales bacterium]